MKIFYHILDPILNSTYRSFFLHGPVLSWAYIIVTNKQARLLPDWGFLWCPSNPVCRFSDSSVNPTYNSAPVLFRYGSLLCLKIYFPNFQIIIFLVSSLKSGKYVLQFLGRKSSECIFNTVNTSLITFPEVINPSFLRGIYWIQLRLIDLFICIGVFVANLHTVHISHFVILQIYFLKYRRIKGTVL
jgi:hypothetical protein